MDTSLSRANAYLKLASKPATDRRRFRRVPMEMTGRFMDSDGMEHPCRTLDVSPGDARIMAPKPPKIGENLILYVDQLGRLEAEVRRADPYSFGVRFNVSPHKRERLADTLTEILVDPPAFYEGRRERRYEAQTAAGAIVELEDGAQLHCEIMDFSLVGVALRTARTRPLIGAWVRLGHLHGRVSRYFENGFAIDFQAR